MRRKRFTEREVIETLAWQGIGVPCFRCKKPICIIVEYRKNDCEAIWTGLPEREHIHELALGGSDVPENCRYSCSECHKKITNGTKATSAGSSKHRIAKVKRLRNPKPSKRPMPKTDRKIPSRQFPKRAA